MNVLYLYREFQYPEIWSFCWKKVLKASKRVFTYTESYLTAYGNDHHPFDRSLFLKTLMSSSPLRESKKIYLKIHLYKYSTTFGSSLSWCRTSIISAIHTVVWLPTASQVTFEGYDWKEVWTLKFVYNFGDILALSILRYIMFVDGLLLNNDVGVLLIW